MSYGGRLIPWTRSILIKETISVKLFISYKCLLPMISNFSLGVCTENIRFPSETSVFKFLWRSVISWGSSFESNRAFLRDVTAALWCSKTMKQRLCYVGVRSSYKVVVACHNHPSRHLTISQWASPLATKYQGINSVPFGEHHVSLWIALWGKRCLKSKTRKISHCGTRSPKYAGLCHFTLLFCRGWQRNVQRFKTHGQKHCFSH